MSTSRPRAALVRAVSPRFAEAVRTFRDHEAIDVVEARAQHTAYRAALSNLDVEVVGLPDADDHPDGVFVEDAAVVIDDLAVLTRPGAASRRDEPATLAPTLEGRGMALARIEAPGHLDGGDVLRVDDTLYVGVGVRTDREGVRQLAELAASRGRRVVPVAVPGALHLKTAVTALPDGTLIGMPGWVEVAGFDGQPVHGVPEPAGANVLLVGEHVLVSASAPRTAEMIEQRGFAVSAVDIGELEKAEAGLTCMSVLLP